MSLSAIRATVSFFTLNALLQTYENQPVEFWDSNMSHPKLTPIVQSNQYLNLLVGFTTFAVIDKNNKINILCSLLVGASVIIQNLNVFLPKTLNMISIYLQLIVLIHQVFIFLQYYYDKIPSQMPNITKDIMKEQKQIRKQTQKKSIYQKKKDKIQPQKIQQTQIQQIIEPELQDNNTEVESIENDFSEFIKQPSNDQTATEIETENLYEINHADLSQISQVKEETKLTFQLKFNNEDTQINCTFETFDQAMTILNSTYTQEQTQQIKIHLLLNLYDENEDCTCRLWCLKKLLALN